MIAKPAQSRGRSGLAVVAAILGIGLVLLAIAAVIVLALIPLYLSQRQLPVSRPSCGSCTINVRNRYNNGTAVLETNVGYYSCDQFCSANLPTGAPGSDEPTYNFAADALASLGGVINTCSIAGSTGGVCTSSYGDVTTFTGSFFTTNGSICQAPNTAFRCCCVRSSG